VFLRLNWAASVLLAGEMIAGFAPVGGKITSPVGYKVVAKLQQPSCGRPNTVLGYNAEQYDVAT
jgi:hypothetical protein